MGAAGPARASRDGAISAGTFWGCSRVAGAFREEAWAEGVFGEGGNCGLCVGSWDHAWLS